MQQILLKFSIAFSFILIGISGFAQDAKVIELMNDGQYQQAVDAILSEGDIAKIDNNSLSSLAYCYVMMRDYPQAENIYREITSRKKFDEVNHLYLGEVLLINEKYLQAKRSFEQYLESDPESEAVKVKIASCDSLKLWSQSTSKYTVKNKKIVNTEFDEKSVCQIEDAIIFVSNIVPDAYRSSQILTENQVKEYKHFDGQQASYFPQLLEKYSCEALDFCESRNLLAMTLREKTEYMLETSFSNAAIYFATPHDINSLMKFEWEGMPEEINLAHPAFANEGRRLYFVSDMSGGFGANDIWYSDYVDSKWQTPVNAGETINTSGNELFPVVYNDSLFFSSDGRAGYGNLDIYLSVNGSEPVNMKAPINSKGNDFSFQISDQYNGYFSSNRSESSMGMNDIFSWSLPLPPPPPPIDTTSNEPEILVFDFNFKPYAILFESEEDKIDPIYSDYLQQISDTLKQYPEIKVKLTGHSDARGSKTFSTKLAESRPKNIAAYLMDLGISIDRIDIETKGISKDREIPGMLYHVQIASSKNKNAQAWFEKKLNMPVKQFQVDEYTTYYVGTFDNKQDAIALQKQIKNTFDGLIIASFMGKRLPDLYYAPNRRVVIEFVK